MFPEKFFSSAYKHVLASEQDIFHEEELLKSESHFFSEEVYKIVNSNSVYNYEKNQSSSYRLVFSIETVASNVLMNINGDDSYESLTTERVYIAEEDKYTFTEEDILTEEGGQIGYLTGLSENEGCSKNLFRPYPTDLALVSNNCFNNYQTFLSYEYDKDDSIEFNGVPLSDGIAIYSSSTISYFNRDMKKIVTPVSHNLSENDLITIINTSGETDYFVYAIGDELGENKKNMFILDDNILITPNSSFKRKKDGIKSKYYISKHKKLNNAVTIYKNAFANTIYSDTIFSLNVNEDLDISDIKDNFNRPLTKVFLTIVKKRHTEYENFFFNDIKSGIYTMFANSDYDITTLSDVLGTPLENTINLEDMYGNLIEYNEMEQKVYYLEPIYHRFNSKNRSDNGYHEGYYYVPHIEVQLKNFSEYINDSKEDAPDYAYQFNENRYIFRDLENNQFSSIWPFTNGKFYVYKKTFFFLLRQDPCFLYGSGNQNPIKGKCKDFSMQKINLSDNEC